MGDTFGEGLGEVAGVGIEVIRVAADSPLWNSQREEDGVFGR